MTLPDIESERDDIPVEKERYDDANNVTVHDPDTVNTGGVPTPFSNVKGRRATLADLIGVCRVKGLQVYNNVPNIPEAEKIRIAEETERQRIAAERERALALERERERREGYELSSDGGRSVGSHMTSRTDRKWRNRSGRRSSRSRRSTMTRSRLDRFDEDGSNADTNGGESLHHVTNGGESLHHVTNGHHSLVPRSPAMSTRSLARSHLTSRSSMRSRQDIPDDLADIDAEEILQRRIRRRSRRHRESIDILVSTMSSKPFEPVIAPKDTKLQTIDDEDDGSRTQADNTKAITDGDVKSDNGQTPGSGNSGNKNGDSSVASEMNLETTKSDTVVKENSAIKTKDSDTKQNRNGSNRSEHSEIDNDQRVVNETKRIADSVHTNETMTEAIEDKDIPLMSSTPHKIDKKVVDVLHEDRDNVINDVRTDNDIEQAPLTVRPTHKTEEEIHVGAIKADNHIEREKFSTIKTTDATKESSSTVIVNDDHEEHTPSASKTTDEHKETSSAVTVNGDTEEHTPSASKTTEETEDDVIKELVIQDGDAKLILYNTRKQSTLSDSQVNMQKDSAVRDDQTSSPTAHPGGKGEDDLGASDSGHETFATGHEQTRSPSAQLGKVEDDLGASDSGHETFATGHEQTRSPSAQLGKGEDGLGASEPGQETFAAGHEQTSSPSAQLGKGEDGLGASAPEHETLAAGHDQTSSPTAQLGKGEDGLGASAPEHETLAAGHDQTSSPSAQLGKRGDSLDVVDPAGNDANISHAPSRPLTETSKSGSINARDTEPSHVSSRSTDKYTNIDKAALTTGINPDTLSEKSTQDGVSSTKSSIKNANVQKAENDMIISPSLQGDGPVNTVGTGDVPRTEIDGNSGGTFDLSNPAEINRSHISKHNEDPGKRKSAIGGLIIDEQLNTYNNEGTKDRRSRRDISEENIHSVDGDTTGAESVHEKVVNRKEAKMADVDITDKIPNGKIMNGETMRSSTPAESVKSVKSGSNKRNGVVKHTHNDSYESEVIDIKTPGDGEHGRTDGRTDSEDIASRQTKQSNKTTGSSGSTSSGKTSVKTMSSEARMILLMTRLRQTYDEENETQTNYVTELSHAREELRREYESLRNYDGLLDFEPRKEVKKEEKKPPKESNEQLDESFEHVINEVVKVQVSAKPEEPVKVEKPMKPVVVEQSTESRPHQESNYAPVKERDSNHVSIKEREKLVINSDWTPPANVDKKVDCRWDPDHPLYKEIQTGFKSKSKLPNTRRLQMELKRLNKKTFSTGNIPPNNVYLIEAKRRYPSGFYAGENNSSGNVKKKAKVATSSPKADSPYNQPLVLDSKSHHRNVQRAKRKDQAQNKNKRSTNDNVESDTTATGESNSPGPIRKRPTRRYVKPRSDSVDSDEERLHKDKKTVEEYQHYIENKSDLPAIKDSNKKVAKSNGHKQLNGSVNKVPDELPKLRFDSNKTAVNETHSRIRSKPAVQKSGSCDSDPEHVTGRDTNGYDGDESDMNSKGSTAAKTGSTIQSTGKSSDIPIGNAVDIVQSRQKFYTKNTAEREKPREHRVLKLFRDLQEIRRKAELHENTKPSDVTDMHEEKDPGFLVMKYDSPRVSDDVREQGNDLALRRFLYAPLEYEICSKGPPLHLSQKKREKALDMLQQKVYNRLKGSHRVK